MAGVAGNLGCAEGEQEDVTLLEDLPLVLKETTAPLTFCGISGQGFTPVETSNCKDKSRRAQLKARRRSTIGLRGSPETNSLIRFMAQKWMKTPPHSQTPEPVRSSPFFPRVTSNLKQKMASFQCLMDVGEGQACDTALRQDGDAGGSIKTRGYLSDGSAHEGEKENRPSAPSAKQMRGRHVATSEACKLQIREAGAPVLHWSSEKGALFEGSPALDEAQDVLTRSPAAAAFKLPSCSILESKQEVDFELKSLCQPPPDGAAAAAASTAAPPSSHQLAPLPSHSEMKPAENDTSIADSRTKKKKSVRFGGPLSPEYFDKHLPPSTPLQKGGTPARFPTPGETLRSVLKTPQRSDPVTPTAAAEPGLDVPAAFGASPVFKMPRNRRMPSVGEDDDGQIFQRTMEEMEAQMTGDGEYWPDAQPLNLNNAFHEELEAQSLTESESQAAVDSQTDDRTSVPEEPEQQQQQLEAEVKPPVRMKQSRKRPAPEGEAPAEGPTRTSSRKRKNLVESEPVKRSRRSGPKAASGKTTSSMATRRWKKDVDRSLYGSRAYASKNPILSPITESLSFCRRPSSTSCTGSEAPLEMARHTVADACESPSGGSNSMLEQEVSDESPNRGEEPTTAGQDVETPETVTATEQEVDEPSSEAVTAPAVVHSDQDCAAPTSDVVSPAPRKTKRGRRSSTHRSELSLVADLQASSEVEAKEEEKEEQRQQHSISSGSSGQEEVEGVGLAPWQTDFDCEDIFRPVASGGRRSVRRSLRNRSGVENGSGQGLAWLPPSPTDPSGETRRRTRGRRLSSGQPV